MRIQSGQSIPDTLPASASDQLLFLDRAIGDGQSRLILTFPVRLDEVRLERAVRLSLDAEPVLGCRFVERPWRPHWRRLHDMGNVFSLYPVDPLDLELELSDFLTAPLDPRAGPQLRVGLFRSDQDVLCIKISHTVADGGASMDYTMLLRDIYRWIKDDPGYRLAPNISGCRGSNQVLRRIDPGQLLAACARFSVPRAAWGFPENGNDHSGGSFMVRRIGNEWYEHIRAYAWQHRATVGEVFLTAYYRALFEALDPPENVPLPVVVPADLRKRIPSGRSEGICNLSFGLFPAIERKKGELFEETLSRVRASMAREKTKQTEIAQMLFMELAASLGFGFLGAMQKTINAYMMHPSFSNLGVIDPSIGDFGDAEAIEVYGLGPIPYPPHFVLGIMTFKGNMILTAGYCHTSIDTAFVSRIFDVLLDEVPGAFTSGQATDMEQPLERIPPSRLTLNTRSASAPGSSGAGPRPGAPV